MADIYFTGNNQDTIYQTSGFSSTILNSVDVSSIDTQPQGVEWNGDEIQFSGNANKVLYRLSGFTTTITDSLDVSAEYANPGSMFDNTTDENENTYWTKYDNTTPSRIFLKHSGFSTTKLDSVDYTSIGFNIRGMVWDGTDLRCINLNSAKVIHLSGFSSTITNSLSVSGVDSTPYGTTWDGQDTYIGGNTGNDIYHLSGFTTTVIDSFDITALEPSIFAISTSDITGRLGITADYFIYWCGDVSAKLYQMNAFSGYINDEIDVSATDVAPYGIVWDGTNTLWSGAVSEKSYKMSGFSSTFLDSFSSTAIDVTITGVTWDGTDQYAVGYVNQFAYHLSGFSSTVLDSIDMLGLDWQLTGVSYNQSGLMVLGRAIDVCYQFSGFTSTQLDSVDFTPVDTEPKGVTWNGQQVMFGGDTSGYIFKMSGFTTTVVDSFDRGGIDSVQWGLSNDNVEQRMGVAGLGFPYIPKVEIGKITFEKDRSKWIGHPLLYMKERPVLAEDVIHPEKIREDAVILRDMEGVEAQSVRWVGTVPGVAVIFVSWENGVGKGILKSVGSNNIFAWKAPGSDTFGSTVNCSVDGNYILEDGEDQSKYIRIGVYNDYLSTSPVSTNIYIECRYETLLSGEDVEYDEALNGDDSWWSAELYNQSETDVLDLKLWMSQETQQNGYWLADGAEIEEGNKDYLRHMNGGVCNRYSGFSTTLKDSLSTWPPITNWGGQSWYDLDLWFTGTTDDKAFRASGFSTTIIDSVDISALGTTFGSLDIFEDDTVINSQTDLKIYRLSAFTTTILDSFSISAYHTNLTGVNSYNNYAFLLWCGYFGASSNELFKMSGFSSTILDSINTTLDFAQDGITWDGQNMVTSGNALDKFYKYDGFSSTIIDSLDFSEPTTVTMRDVEFMNSNIKQGNVNWVQPYYEDHPDTLSWSRVESLQGEIFGIRRVVPAGTSPSFKKKVDFDWSYFSE